MYAVLNILSWHVVYSVLDLGEMASESMQLII